MEEKKESAGSIIDDILSLTNLAGSIVGGVSGVMKEVTKKAIAFGSDEEKEKEEERRRKQ